MKGILNYKPKLKEGDVFNNLTANKEGYSINNCITCCKKCNYAKNDMSQEEFKKWIHLIINNKSKLLF